ncbi:MAG: GxxExxY protein, partial [Candidatus Binataceae bacterium]
MRGFDPIPEAVDRIASEVIDAAFAVHKALGPGLLESVYETCLCLELAAREIKYRTQVMLPIDYKGVRMESGLRLDLVVADSVIVELKAVEKMLPVFEAQLLTYLRLARLRLGLLINFNTPLLKT